MARFFELVCLVGPRSIACFPNPSRDGVSLLKIWNINKYTGVLGVYNCQGAAWNSVEINNTFHQTKPEAITGYILGRDVHLISEVALDSNWNGDVALYSHRAGTVTCLPYNIAMPISLKVLEHELFTVTPIKVLVPGFNFAPLGLIDMFNGGGAIEEVKYEVKTGAQLVELESGNGGRIENLGSEVVAVVGIEVKGCGRFGVYSSVKPRKCGVGSSAAKFEYDAVSGLVTLKLTDMPPDDQKVHYVEIEL